MVLNSSVTIPHPISLKGRGYVERKQVHFFDFFRNVAFGFVSVDGKKGYYPQATLGPDGELDTFCNCHETKRGQICSHGFAVFLRLINWPNERTLLSEAFNQYELNRFFQVIGHGLFKWDFREADNPKFTPPTGVLEPRLLDYLGFGEPEESGRIKRDRTCLSDAKEYVREYSELKMLANGFPSARVLYEESQLYALAKLLFFVEQAATLRYQVTNTTEHQVIFTIHLGSDCLFRWQLPIDKFLKGIQKNRAFWEPLTAFRIQSNGQPVVYRCNFIENNNLEIEPMIALDTDHFIPLEQVTVPGSHFCFHEKLGYFTTQTGLSAFEMQYAKPGIARISYKLVKRFLKEHRDTLEDLDRTLMDDSLFGEVIAVRFDGLELHLIDFNEPHFIFELRAQLGGYTYEVAELLEKFSEQGRYVNIGGKVFDSTGYDAIYLQPLLAASQHDQRLTAADLFRFTTFFKDRLEIKTNQLTEAAFARLRDMRPEQAPDLAATNLQLRAYQESGYQWLYFLYQNGLGGLLCDQMGLGKTHQGMALLAAVCSRHPESRHLVVAPASVLYHWKDKLRTFCPGLKALIHHGSDRDAARALRHAQVIITSYATLRNDAQHFGDYGFHLIIFDEAQYLKNSATKSYQEISQLRANSKIGLTGTPIENHLSELKGLMDLVFPGFLGSSGHFKRHFLDPIQNFDNPLAKRRLQNIIKPFTLRRSKSEVLQELPEKSEDLRSYQLSDYEKDLYLDIKKQAMGKVTQGDGTGKQVMHLFQVIDMLKRLCNHPALHFKNTDYAAYPSAKWSLFTELLQEALAAGEKVVVFTQFLGMIALFERYLREQNIDFACITGKVKDRGKQQERFQTDPNCRVFLGTIMAAGTGIDLTAGSVLFHYDRWWNAAREEQATDRIHRIGQDKAVQIFKFRGIDTVEERIAKIIESKAKLLDEVVTFDDEHLSKHLTLEELLEVLA